MKNVLIATCGTSVLTNQRYIKEQIAGDKNYDNISVNELGKIKKHILKNLKNKKPYEKICGAEINSIYYLIKERKFSGKKIYLIVTDSIEGELSGMIISEILKEKFEIEEVVIKQIKNLDIKLGYEFAKDGITHLKNDLIEIINFEKRENIMIAPLGGLKALVIIVALIGNNYNIPCYYLFEGSTDIIKILP